MFQVGTCSVERPRASLGVNDALAATMRIVATAPEAPTWPRFVTSAFIFTLTAGTLSGAIDLWTLRLHQLPVPIDHQRSHALTQLFGFLGLFIMGLSLHLGPRFWGAKPPSRRFGAALSWPAIGGVVLVIIGRLGRLVPGSAALGLLGGGALMVAMSLWAKLIIGFWLDLPGRPDVVQRGMLAGVAWWWLSAALLFAWQLGQTLGGVTANVPLESIWSTALFGGAGSWLLGLFFRPGIAVLRLEAPTPGKQRVVFIAWQLATVLSVFASWNVGSALEAPAGLALGGAALLWWWVVRPFSGPKSEAGPLQPLALRAGATFFLVFAVLEVWTALGVFGLWTPALLRDAARHAFSLGTVTTMLLGFAGRMVPAFGGVPLRWPALYDAGVLAVIFGTTLRMGELVSARLGLALAGASGALSFLGLALVGVTLLTGLRARDVDGGVRA